MDIHMHYSFLRPPVGKTVFPLNIFHLTSDTLVLFMTTTSRGIIRIGALIRHCVLEAESGFWSRGSEGLTVLIWEGSQVLGQF